MSRTPHHASATLSKPSATTAALQQAVQAADALHFLPYIGPDYAEAVRPVLMIGEAAHGAPTDGDNRRLVEKTVKKALIDTLEDANNDHWVRYVRNIEAMLTGNPYGESSRIWNQVAYGVFLQQLETASGDHSHKDITPEALTRSRAAFAAMLDILAPHYVVAWGLTLYQHHWLADKNAMILLDEDLPAYALKSRPHIPIWHCHHPSRDFSYTEEHQRWERFRRLKVRP